MHVQFWGAARTVTGSMHLVEVGGRRLLLDCGLYQGSRKEAFLRNRQLPFPAAEIDAVVLSHAHIDHSGNLPSLVKSGFRGPIYATSATRDLAVFMLLDSAEIQRSDVKYINKKRTANNQTPFEPLYLQEDAMQAIRQFRTVEFGSYFSPVENIEVRFHRAGHMLGAASIELNVTGPQGRQSRLVYSGDIGRTSMPILRDPEIAAGADFIVMEATYGNRNHEQDSQAVASLLQAAQNTYDRGGKLIIPAFSVGRTQEVVYRLNLLWETGQLPPIKVFVDSPLAVNATGVFQSHPECFDPEMIQQLMVLGDDNPFGFDHLHYIRDAEYSKRLNNLKEPCIIISASGMCEAGRILHHLKHNISKSSTTIMFAGYQAPDTLGRHILDGTKETVNIFGEPYTVRAQVCRLESSSGHADQSELLQWAIKTRQQGNVQQIALVHCELDAAEPFRKLLLENGINDVVIPNRGETMSLISPGSLK